VTRRISLLLLFLAPAAFAAGSLSDRVDAIGREAIAHHRAPGLAIGVMSHGSYALGIGVGTNNGHRVLFHAGGINGFDAMVTHYPDDDVSIVVLANADGELAGEVEYQVARTVLRMHAPAVITLTSTERQRVAGKYTGRGGDVSVVARDGALFLDGVKLLHLGAGTFAEEGAADVVTIEGRTLKITHYGATRFEGERVP
jgi:hypothetical protein